MEPKGEMATAAADSSVCVFTWINEAWRHRKKTKEKKKKLGLKMRPGSSLVMTHLK